MGRIFTDCWTKAQFKKCLKGEVSPSSMMRKWEMFPFVSNPRHPISISKIILAFDGQVRLF
jgi:hypothetical protein